MVLFKDTTLLVLSFLVFELLCGIYYPCISTLRAKYIPEHSRSTIMNIYRIPLNLLIVLVLIKVFKTFFIFIFIFFLIDFIFLLNIKVVSYNNSTVFLICAVWCGSAFLLHQFLKLSQTQSHLER
jgi:hypothetical protein